MDAAAVHGGRRDQSSQVSSSLASGEVKTAKSALLLGLISCLSVLASFVGIDIHDVTDKPATCADSAAVARCR